MVVTDCFKNFTHGSHREEVMLGHRISGWWIHLLSFGDQNFFFFSPKNVETGLLM